MADTFTTNLSLTKPDIGGSTDTWGNKLNANADALDAMFPSGDLAVANGGTGASDASTARSNLGLGTMATQNASAVSVTGGTAVLSDLRVESTAPYIGWRETDAPVDNSRWRIYTDGQQWTLRLYNDALSSYGTALTVTRSGTSPSVVNVGTTLQVSGNVVYHAGNISAATIAESQIADGTVLARVAGNETVSGTWNFTTRPTISGNNVLDAASSLAWANITGTPSTFTPTAHNHDASNITTGTFAETMIADGSILARVGSAETITGAWNYTTRPTISGSNVLDAASSLAWGNLTGVPSTFTPASHNHSASEITSGTFSESMIADGSLLARNAGNETISGAWTISGSITRSSQGRYVYLNGTGNTGGAITLSTSAASGTPSNGDFWFQHEA